MKTSRVGRRDFLKACVAAGVAAKTTLAGRLFGASAGAAYDAKGLPTVTLGKTGAVVPRIGIGLGSRFCAVESEDRAVETLRAALDHGFYYWDSAHNYTNKDIVSEARIGKVLKDRRGEVFMATKFEARTYDGVMRELEVSLKRLQTDHLDLYQIHQVQSHEDIETLAAPHGALEALRKIKEQKIARFIGFSGHGDAAAMAEAARRFGLDTMLIALNHYEERKGDLEGGAIPVAAAGKMGIMIIKSIRPRETVREIAPESLIRYALTLPLVDAAVVGTDSVEVVKKNAALLANFVPLPPAEMERLRVKLEPFMTGTHMPWMRPGYHDGEMG